MTSLRGWFWDWKLDLQTPVGMTADAPTGRRHTAMRRLDQGFQTLSLDPSPRLRLARLQARAHDPIAEAWTATAQALWHATRSLGASLHSR